MSADVVVVGAGVIGSSIARELVRSGRRVVVVDKAGGVGHGSTSASSAVVRFNFSTHAGVATAWESQFCWRHWAEHLGCDVGPLARFERSGLAMLDVDLPGVRGGHGRERRAEHAETSRSPRPTRSPCARTRPSSTPSSTGTRPLPG